MDRVPSAADGKASTIARCASAYAAARTASHARQRSAPCGNAATCAGNGREATDPSLSPQGPVMVVPWPFTGSSAVYTTQRVPMMLYACTSILPTARHSLTLIILIPFSFSFAERSIALLSLSNDAVHRTLREIVRGPTGPLEASAVHVDRCYLQQSDRRVARILARCGGGLRGRKPLCVERFRRIPYIADRTILLVSLSPHVARSIAIDARPWRAVAWLRV
jgi:hypothetical protein